MKVLPALFGLFALSLAPAGVLAENLLENASFEQPKVKGMTDARKGGTMAAAEGKNTWTHLQSLDQSGKIAVGITNEIARTGEQSIYVRFDQAEKVKPAFLMSDLVPVQQWESYRVSLWGRIDRKKPLTLDQGRPYLQADVEFYGTDQASRIGDIDVRTQMIPGSPKRLLFVTHRWAEYYATFKAPEGASFMKVTFWWYPPKGEGAAKGLIYFDDASIEGKPGTSVPSLDPPSTAEPQGEAAAGTPAPAAKDPR